MAEGMVVDFSPVPSSESAYQEQQRRLRLMEIGDKSLYNLELIARSNDDLRRGVKGLQSRLVEPGNEGGKGSGYILARRIHRAGRQVVGFPLIDVKLVLL